MKTIEEFLIKILIILKNRMQKTVKPRRELILVKHSGLIKKFKKKTIIETIIEIIASSIKEIM